MSIFLSNQIPASNQWTWTITSRFADMLEKAETKYGKRLPTHTLVGVECAAVQTPHLFYFGANPEKVIIRLTKQCINDIDYAVFQLSQEIIHCLSPSGNANTIVLDEGLATHFGNEYYASLGFTKWKIDDPKYVNALVLVQQLLAIDPNIIQKVRVIKPSISNIKKEHLLAANPNIPENLAGQLTAQY